MNPADILGTVTDAEAGRALGISTRAACRLRAKLGIAPCRRRADGDATRARVLGALTALWQTTAEIARAAGVSEDHARHVLGEARGVEQTRRGPRLLWRRA